MTSWTACFTHRGPWDASTRDLSALSFIEKYANQVDSRDISGPFHEWYAPSCIFYNADGAVYHGGDKVWTWMKTLFGPFQALRHDIAFVRLFDASRDEAAHARGAQWIVLETETSFTLKGQLAASGPIILPRLLMFLVGDSEVVGQGTNGMQILEAKVWWDSGALEREVTKRKGQLDMNLLDPVQRNGEKWE